MNARENNTVLNKAFNFSLLLIPFTEELRSRRKFEMSTQLFRSGTSIGANIFEAQEAESRQDFIHKLKIAAKECEETFYWLQLCCELNTYPTPDSQIQNHLNEIQKLLSRILGTSKKRIYS